MDKKPLDQDNINTPVYEKQLLPLIGKIHLVAGGPSFDSQSGYATPLNEVDSTPLMQLTPPLQVETLDALYQAMKALGVGVPDDLVDMSHHLDLYLNLMCVAIEDMRQNLTSFRNEMKGIFNI